MIQGLVSVSSIYRYTLKFLLSGRQACAIPDTENGELIITGGEDNRKLVSVYSETGWKRDLASLREGRKLHACGNYVNHGKKVKMKIESSKPT